VVMLFFMFDFSYGFLVVFVYVFGILVFVFCVLGGCWVVCWVFLVLGLFGL